MSRPFSTPRPAEPGRARRGRLGLVVYQLVLILLLIAVAVTLLMCYGGRIGNRPASASGTDRGDPSPPAAARPPALRSTA